MNDPINNEPGATALFAKAMQEAPCVTRIDWEYIIASARSLLSQAENREVTPAMAVLFFRYQAVYLKLSEPTKETLNGAFVEIMDAAKNLSQTDPKTSKVANAFNNLD